MSRPENDVMVCESCLQPSEECEQLGHDVKRTTLILCSGYCEHGKFMGECIDCALAELEEE